MCHAASCKVTLVPNVERPILSGAHYNEVFAIVEVAACDRENLLRTTSQARALSYASEADAWMLRKFLWSLTRR